MSSVSITIENRRTVPHLIWIEPWATDITMLPGQTLVVTNTDTGSDDRPWFSLVEFDRNTQIYVERGQFPVLMLDCVSVECGHNRDAAIEAGIYH